MIADYIQWPAAARTVETSSTKRSFHREFHHLHRRSGRGRGRRPLVLRPAL